MKHWHYCKSKYYMNKCKMIKKKIIIIMINLKIYHCERALKKKKKKKKITLIFLISQQKEMQVMEI
jgi:hypothetical protein